jgi:hypothetical protein
MQPISYLHLGEEVRRSNMQHTSVNGFCTVTKGRLIQYAQFKPSFRIFKFFSKPFKVSK